jgi:hypothetical protein
MQMRDSTKNVRIETFPLSLNKDRLVEPDEARKAIMSAVDAIPVEKLKNIRAGQVTIVM